MIDICGGVQGGGRPPSLPKVKFAAALRAFCKSERKGLCISQCDLCDSPFNVQSLYQRSMR